MDAGFLHVSVSQSGAYETADRTPPGPHSGQTGFGRARICSSRSASYLVVERRQRFAGCPGAGVIPPECRSPLNLLPFLSALADVPLAPILARSLCDSRQ